MAFIKPASDVQTQPVCLYIFFHLTRVVQIEGEERARRKSSSYWHDTEMCVVDLHLLSLGASVFKAWIPIIIHS